VETQQVVERRMTGPKARYRGKLRERPIALTLTAEGHAALTAGTAATGLSRSDYIESLLRRARTDLAKPHL
jgi:hypothetical protein